MNNTVSDSIPDHSFLFFNRSALKIGEVNRYVIHYDLYQGDELPVDVTLDSLWLKIKNVDPLSYRAGYLAGPYILYCDVRIGSYDHSKTVFATVDYPQYESTLQAQQQKVVELSLHRIQRRYTWTIDVISQVILSTTASVTYEISIAKRKDVLLSGMVPDVRPGLEVYSSRLNISKLDTLDLWKLPAQIPSEATKKHLVILTHGMHSNVSADMLYIQEQIYKAQSKDSNTIYIVDGFTKNVCETEKGIRYLGKRVAEYILDELYDESVTEISFIGHSLGGLIQTFALAYIAVKCPSFFQKVDPINFITIASPLLGIVTDNPTYIKMFLSLGVIGKTGQDLSLDNASEDEHPLLYLLSGEPVHSILSKFKRRTVYANAVNDGMVPLYSSALLFLDYDDILRKLAEVKDHLDEENPLPTSNNMLPSLSFSKIWKSINESKLLKDERPIPKATFLETAASILLPPGPTDTFIVKPNSRYYPIIHDKMYSDIDIPEPNSKDETTLLRNTNIFMQTFSPRETDKTNFKKLEEAIARRWHQGMTWRKVVVALKPDAHNNIFVRRRFTNAYGWGVVDHIIENHFSASCIFPQTGRDIDVPSILNNVDASWVVNNATNGVFDQGPTGMMTTVHDMLDEVTKQTFTNLNNSVEENQLDPNDDVVRYDESNLDLYL